MASPADDLPDLERLMRNVVRMAMQNERGVGWIASLSRGQQQGIERAGELAKAKRPQESLRDGWDAVGLGELGGFLRAAWPQAMTHIWPNAQTAAVDLERLIAYRDKNLHAVGPPTGQIGEQEIAAMVLRLRVGLEAARRELLDDTGEWWPYVAAVHSNIPEFRFERSSSGNFYCQATLIEGDLVTLDAVGVHPTDDASLLRYRLLSTAVPELRERGWVNDGSFTFSVPLAPLVVLNLYVADREVEEWELLMTDYVSFQIRVRPLPR